MTNDPLLSDDLPTLLQSFPNNALRDLVAILKQYPSLSPFPARRAEAAHELPADGNFNVHAKDIADEVLWWGSHDIHQLFGGAPGWVDVLVNVAEHLGVPKEEREPAFPAWKVEQAIFCKVLANWEHLTPAEREAAMSEAGLDLDAIRGGVAAATGTAVTLGARQLLLLLGRSAGGAAIPFLGPVLAAAGIAWGAYDLAGPGYRVLRPVTLFIAFHRRRLRDERIAAAFRD